MEKGVFDLYANPVFLAGANPFAQFQESFTQDGNVYKYFDLPSIDSKYGW